ncbi:hypothetical protein GCM10023169_17340 [Georgenia halophila]|uniref:histidine kinase n=1 Tax=Georgenia halophila TaxID=620889 RepID=A0ABP8L6S8_9MICO
MTPSRNADRPDAEHVPSAIDDWVLPRLPYRSFRGDVAMSVGIVLLGVLVAFTVFGRWAPEDDRSVIVMVAALVSAGALLLKRRLPVLAVGVIAGMLIGEAALTGRGTNLAVLIALFDALYATALVGSRRERTIVTLACAVASVAVLVLSTGSVAERVQYALSAVALLGTPLFIATASRQRDALVQAEKARAGAEAARADAVVRAAVAEREQAVRAERATLARDLHDAVAAHLSAIALQSGAAVAQAGAGGSSMRAVRESSLEALSELRQLIDVLSADDPGELPLRVPPGLGETEILRADAQRLGIDLVLDVDVPREALTTATSRVLMRIAKEALVNAARHAPGSAVTVTARAGLREVVLRAVNRLTDPGTGGGAGLGTGLGTVIMAEQASAVGGVCRAGPGDDGTWVVRAEVPRHVPAQAVVS